jgi:hypothetical protein
MKKTNFALFGQYRKRLIWAIHGAAAPNKKIIQSVFALMSQKI